MEMTQLATGTKCANAEEPHIDSDSERRDRDFNTYATNKTIAQGLLDFALLATNVSQMKYILQVGPRHPYYHLLLAVISVSFVLQVVVGILLLLLGNRSSLKARTSRLNHIITVLIFLITVMNVVISGFNMEVTGPSRAACVKFHQVTHFNKTVLNSPHIITQ